MSCSGLVRRDLLRLGGGAFAVAALPGSLRAGAMPARAGVIAIHDARFSDARAFAAAAAASGAIHHASERDVAALWYERLGPEARSAAFAGLTTYADMVVIGGIAAEAGRRLSFRASHDGRGRERIRHAVLTGNRRAAGLLDRSGGAWPQALWAFLSDRPDRLAGLPQSAQPGRRASDHPGVLWSWLVI